jgi:hypothetical protein
MKNGTPKAENKAVLHLDGIFGEAQYLLDLIADLYFGEAQS